MDWTNPAGAAVSGGFGLLGSYLNYKYNQKLAEQQNAYNLQMWNLNNEYNKPLNQMKRYEEAGLNPALMYGQVTPGTSSSPPQQVTPNAPEISGSMKDLAQAFNIEGLRTAIANRKKAQADAQLAQANADAAEGENKYFQELDWYYKLSPNGQFVRKGLGDTFDVHGSTSGAIAAGRVLQALAENYRTNSLLVPRANLIGTQASLNRSRTNLLAPQIRMSNYSSKYFPYTFWIGNVKNGVSALSPFF